MAATKLDLKQELKDLYRAGRRPALVNVPELQFLMIDGQGDPNTAPAYGEAVEALFAVAYTIKFAVKKSAEALDYPVMPLEALWWAADPGVFLRGQKDEWRWTVMIMQPGIVDRDHLAAAVDALKARRSLPALAEVRLESFAEGRAAQLLHLGPYSAEEPTIRALHEFIAAQGLQLSGRHHEIYLGDPRRAAPEKLRTIIRQPVTG